MSVTAKEMYNHNPKMRRLGFYPAGANREPPLPPRELFPTVTLFARFRG